jgi:hypothetical protein
MSSAHLLHNAHLTPDPIPNFRIYIYKNKNTFKPPHLSKFKNKGTVDIQPPKPPFFFIFSPQ